MPFCYESNGDEIRYTNLLDPEPRSRDIFGFHRPELLRHYVQQEKQTAQLLQEYPALPAEKLWSAQIEAITNLEKSLAAGKRRALIQMVTGSGKTFTVVNFVYRILKQTPPGTRVLFLVDRGNLGEQTLKEFQQFVSPLNNYKFHEEFVLQHLTSNTVNREARVVISTIQRLYSMLRGEAKPVDDLDDLPLESSLYKEPVPVEYNPDIPVEMFDFIVIDECHRSIYNIWRQVVEYFDASLIGLTATPSKETSGRMEKTTLGDVVSIIRGVTYKKEDASKEYFDNSVPIFRATNIQEQLVFDEMIFVPSKYVNENQILREGDIIIAASSGSKNIVGKAAIFTNKIHCSFGAFCFGLRHCITVHPKFLAHFLQTNYYRNIVSELSAGININNLRAKQIEAIPFAFPPLPEQEKIVAELERQLTHWDAGTAALRRVARNLKRYRAAVLKSACEGRLVPNEAELARQEHRDYETGEQLLKRILKHRRENWSGRGKYEDVAFLDSSSLPQLPVGWIWVKLDQVADITGGITKGKKHASDTKLREIPYLRVANVQRGFLDLSEMKTIAATEQDIQKLTLKVGDILFNEGGDRDKLGRGWVWEGKIPECIHQNHVFRARLFLRNMSPKFFSYHGNTFGQEWFMKTGKQSVNLASINMTVLRNFPVPLPSLAEQERIVAEVERRLSVIDELEQIVAANLKRASNLKQSILKKAFEG